MKKILLSLILVGIVSSVFFSLQASEEPVTVEEIYKLRYGIVTVEDIYKLRFGILQKKIYPTPEYTVAVRKETLPRIEKFVEQQGISLEQPIEAEAFKCQVDNSNYPACFMRTTNGFKFTFNHWGKVEEYSSPDNWFNKDDEQKDDPKYLGKNRMTSEEIESYARDFLKQQGYGESFDYYKTQPMIEGPLKTEKGTYPYVEVEWNSDSENFICTTPNDYYFLVQIDTDKKKLIGCRIYPSAEDIANNYAFFAQDPVQVKVKPMLRQDWLKQTYGKRAEVLDKPIHIDTVYSNAVVNFFVSQAKEGLKKMNFTASESADFGKVTRSAINQRGYFQGALFLSNDWSFSFDNKGYLSKIATPDAFFGRNWYNNKEKFYGTNRMTTNEIVKLAEESLKKFGYDLQSYTNNMTSFSMEGPFGPNSIPNDEHEFPYVLVNWAGSNPDPYFMFQVELNTDKKEVVNIEAYVNCFNESDKRPAFEIGVIPETEAAYQARIQKEKEAVKNERNAVN